MAGHGRHSIGRTGTSLTGADLQFTSIPRVDCGLGANESIRLRFGELSAEQFGGAGEKLARRKLAIPHSPEIACSQ